MPHPAVQPPSTRTEVPVIRADASHAKNNIAPIMSSTSPTRPNLILFKTHLVFSGSENVDAVKGVRTKVGQTEFTLMLY